MNLSSEEIKALRLFIEKAEKLKSYSLLKMMSSMKTGVTISFKKGENGQIERRGPGSESIDASVLTVRFFIQDNEKCSIRNISLIYDKIDKRTSIYKKFVEARSLLNGFLNAKSTFIVNDRHFTNREILEIYIYGGLAHSNKEKKRQYDSFSNNPMLRDLMLNQFIFIITNLINFVFFVQNLNSKLLENIHSN